MPKPSQINYDELTISDLKQFTKRGDIQIISEATGFSYDYVKSVMNGNRARKSEKIRKAVVQLIKSRQETIEKIKEASQDV